MYILICAIVIMVVELSVCDKHKTPGPPMIAEDDKDDAAHQFFAKYCVEKNDAILQMVSKCEESVPKEIEIIEKQCISDIRKKQGKTGKQTLIEFRDLECDKKLSAKFHKCLDTKLNDKKMDELEKIYPKPQLDNKAIAMEHCRYDVYKIKHN